MYNSFTFERVNAPFVILDKVVRRCANAVGYWKLTGEGNLKASLSQFIYFTLKSFSHNFVC